MQFVHSGRSNPQRTTPARSTPVDADAAAGGLLRRRWGGGADDDDDGGGGADVGGNLGQTRGASAVVAAPGGDVPTTVGCGAGGDGGGRSPMRTPTSSRNRNWPRSSLAAGGKWRRNRATVPAGPPLDHLW